MIHMVVQQLRKINPLFYNTTLRGLPFLQPSRPLQRFL